MNKLNTIYKIHLVSNTNTLKQVIVFYGASVNDIGKNVLRDTFLSEPTNDMFLDKYTGNPYSQTKNLRLLR